VVLFGGQLASGPEGDPGGRSWLAYVLEGGPRPERVTETEPLGDREPIVRPVGSPCIGGDPQFPGETEPFVVGSDVDRQAAERIGDNGRRVTTLVKEDGDELPVDPGEAARCPGGRRPLGVASLPDRSPEAIEEILEFRLGAVVDVAIEHAGHSRDVDRHAPDGIARVRARCDSNGSVVALGEDRRSIPLVVLDRPAGSLQAIAPVPPFVR
jgi:hypothetical protein